MAESQFNILGTPGASSQNLIANMANRTAQTKQNTTGLLQTMLSTQSQERMAREGEQGATKRAQIGANTSLQQAGMQQQTALAGMKSQEGMQAKQIDATARIEAGRMAHDREVQKTLNKIKMIEIDDLRNHNNALLGYQKQKDERLEGYAREDQTELMDYYWAVKDANDQFHVDQMANQKDALVMQAQYLYKMDNELVADQKFAEITDNMKNDFRAKQMLRDNAIDIAEGSVQNLVSKNPGFYPPELMIQVAAKAGDVKIPNEVFGGGPALAEWIQKSGASGYLMFSSAIDVATRTLESQLNDVNENKPGKMDVAVASLKRKDIATPYVKRKRKLEADLQRLRDLKVDLNNLVHSDIPMDDGHSTLGKNVMSWQMADSGLGIGSLMMFGEDNGLNPKQTIDSLLGWDSQFFQDYLRKYGFSEDVINNMAMKKPYSVTSPGRNTSGALIQQGLGTR
jgi:hypothetical protein